MANAEEYATAIAAVKAGNPTQHQIELAQRMANQSSFLGSSPLTSEARRALESLGNKRK